MHQIEKREFILNKHHALVSIVRCEDCEFYKQNEQFDDGICEFHSTEKRELVCDPDDFCSGGRRREKV